MQESWVSLSVKCESEKAASMQADFFKQSGRIKDVAVEGCKVTYKQLTWVGYDKDSIDD